MRRRRRRTVRPPTEATTMPAITGVLGWPPPLGGGLAASMTGSVPLPVVVLVDPVLLVSAFVMGTIGRVGDVPSGGGAGVGTVVRPSAFPWSVGSGLGGVLVLGITGLGMLLFGPSWSASGGFTEAGLTPIPGLFVGAGAAGSTEGAAGGGGAGGGVGGAGAGDAAGCRPAGGGGGGAGDGSTGESDER